MRKELFIIAGANGSGKSTLANELLLSHKDFLYINADDIAKKLNPRNIDFVKIRAGKETLNEIKSAFDKKKSFVWESTISGNLVKRILKQAKVKGYKITLIYIFVDNPQICIDRVKSRILKGGHNIPNEDILRRYERSKKNFLVYNKLVDAWELYYNGINNTILAATNNVIINVELYNKFKGII